MTDYIDRTDGKRKSHKQIVALVQRDEDASHAAKMGMTREQLAALRRHPDKQWARAEAKRLLGIR